MYDGWTGPNKQKIINSFRSDKKAFFAKSIDASNMVQGD